MDSSCTRSIRRILLNTAMLPTCDVTSELAIRKVSSALGAFWS